MKTIVSCRMLPKQPAVDQPDLHEQLHAPQIDLELERRCLSSMPHV